ncbi:MAG TPA: hypothetical protein PKG54_05730 [Phycisphaerae bacterium]|nr:hypothetical protein [Phycisphaerae bacterium]
MNSISRVTCLLLAGWLLQVIGCGAFPEGLLDIDPPEEDTWTPVYTPVSSVDRQLLGAPGDSPDAAPSLEVTSGTVEIDTDAVTITVGDTVYTGTVRTQTDGPEVTEFTFASIHLASNVTVTTKGSRVLSLVSKGDVVIDTTLDVSGGDGRLNEGGFGRLGGGRGGTPRVEPVTERWGTWDYAYGEEGQGKGGGKLLSRSPPGGGGFGGTGGWSEDDIWGKEVARYGGQAYGNLALVLEGGSGGGAGMPEGRQTSELPGGGGGGGCIAITAGREIRVSGAILANGGRGCPSPDDHLPGGGGGSGGGILLSGQRLTITGTLSARGGNSGCASWLIPPAAGGGGGGHILLHVRDLAPEESVLTGSFDVGGGSGRAGPPSTGCTGRRDVSVDSCSRRIERSFLPASG